MLLHEHPTDFKDLQELTADYIGIPGVAVERDYYIVMMLEKLAQSPSILKNVIRQQNICR
ncbi:MAG: hypothetical protein IKR28_01365 [Selenomonadaceae bacterium]|nr:hypothetical protein [Selenomonadaceae bacterium]